MKKLLALLIALMLLALPAMADAASEADAATEQTEGVTLERMRYHFEHNVLPRYFYEDPANMLDVLKEKGIYRLWQALADENGVEYPYQEADYELRWYDLEDGATALLITMPAPETSPQCFRAYMIYNPDTGAAGYYTVEYDNFLEESAFLCGWTPDGTHMNYGGAMILDPAADDYEAQLESEAAQVAALTNGN